MSSQPKSRVAFLWSLVALIALCAWPAHAGRAGHRVRRTGGHQHITRQHGKFNSGSCAGGACSSTPARSAANDSK